MRPWFRRRRSLAAPPEAAASEPRQPDPQPAAEELDPAAPLSPDRLDNALKRLRQEIPAPSGESPPGPSE